MEAEQPKLKLYQKLFKIMEAVEFIQKDKQNSHFGYQYASEEIIKKTLHKQLVENKVLFRLGAKNLIRTTRGDQSIVDIEFQYTFLDIETGEVVADVFVGSGEDKGDKGTYKAITGAIKYILTSCFLIPTGDDPENQTTDNNNSSSNKESIGQKNCSSCNKLFKPKFATAALCYSCYKNQQNN